MSFEGNSIPVRFPAGELLADELEARRWPPAHLAALAAMPEQAVTAIIAGDEPITPEIAERIGQALGTSADMWLALAASSISGSAGK